MPMHIPGQKSSFFEEVMGVFEDENHGRHAQIVQEGLGDKNKKPALSELKKEAMRVADHVFLDAWWRNVDRKYRIPDHLYRKPELEQLKTQFKDELAAAVLRHLKRLFKDA